jgi:hypothetical protein
LIEVVDRMIVIALGGIGATAIVEVARQLVRRFAARFDERAAGDDGDIGVAVGASRSGSSWVAAAAAFRKAR